MNYHGSCHCGAIKYTVEGEIDSLMQCNCSICSRKGYLLWFAPKDKVDLQTPEPLGTYTFNKHQIKHHFCPTCGCAPFGFGSDGKGNEMAAINARCLEGLDLSAFAINQVDGKSL